MRSIVWFRGKELRLADHRPMATALAARDEVIPLFVLDPYFFAPACAQELPHRMQFLLESLRALEEAIAACGSRLLVVEGRAVDVVPQLARSLRADRVLCQRWTEPFGRERDRRVGEGLAQVGSRLELTDGETLAPPERVRTAAGGAFGVFSPFSRAFLKSVEVGDPLPAPARLPPLPADVTLASASIPSLESLGLVHNALLPVGGEAAAEARLAAFLDGPAEEYNTDRNRLDLPGTSRLSQDLKFGTISPRTVWRRVVERDGVGAPWRRSFLNELLWREFAHATLWDRPALLSEPFRREFQGFPWMDAPGHWQAWVEGRTGYPVVDAAARQLLSEGFVHNRARMISASFLTKHLLIDYRRGEAHYLKWLVDGDWAQNVAGWQWSAGCGCDAQPYFRIFNPMTQGETFDPTGDYVRRWVPELRGLPTQVLHAPWTATPLELRQAGVELGRTYPLPIVEHSEARARFLAVAKSHLGQARAGGPAALGYDR